MSQAHSFALSSFLTPGPDGGAGSYRLELTNHSDVAVKNFTLGYSGPGRVCREPVENGRLVKDIGSWYEFAPPTGFVLEPGATWVFTTTPEFQLRHWTDGAVTGVFIPESGAPVAVITTPVVNLASTEPYRRGIAHFPVPVPAPVTLSVIPWPNKVAVTGRRSAPDGFFVTTSSAEGAAALAAFTELTTNLFPGEALVRPEEEGGFAVTLDPKDGFGDEAYEIAFFPEAAVVRASTQTGFLYGLITLGQAARGARMHQRAFSFPNGGTITDRPGLAWRGSHFDVARKFFASGEVKQFVRLLAWNKMNRLHWHLSDDEGWRIEIDAYPQLAAKSAWRGVNEPIPPQLGSGPERSGGYYTKAAAREIIALGLSLGVETVPEIDVPGHSYALLVALPMLKDAGENGQYYSVQAYDNNSVNPAVKRVYPVIETIFAELCELFPSKYFHVGADEVPHEAWHSSPDAKALNDEIGGVGPAPLQSHFLRRVQTFLTAQGKITGAWEEAADGGGIDKNNCYLVGWRAVESNLKLVQQGYQVVVAPGQHYYLDMAHNANWQEPGAFWAGQSTVEQTYSFDPTAGWTDEERSKLWGVQACIWCEPMTERAVFERLVFPRLSAIAETGWTDKEHKSLERFLALAGTMPSLYGVVERG